MARVAYLREIGPTSSERNWTPVDEEDFEYRSQQKTLQEQLFDSLFKVENPNYQQSSRRLKDKCHDKCQHLMYIGHGNEYRGCFRRCTGQDLG